MHPAPYAPPRKPAPPLKTLADYATEATAQDSQIDEALAIIRARDWGPRPTDAPTWPDTDEAESGASSLRTAAHNETHKRLVQDASNWNRWLTALHCRARAGRLPPEHGRAIMLFDEPPPSARTLLVSLETSLLTSTRRCFPERSAARAAYLHELQVTARDDNDDRRVLRMQECSTRWQVSQTADGPRLECWRCRERLCPECQRVRAWKYQQAYAEFISKAKRPKFLTLTIATMAVPAGESIDKLYRCFRLLRRREVWKAHCKGGYTVVEITPGKSGIGWHVHLHILMDSVYIPIDWIKDEWFKITDGSHRCNIKAIDAGGAKYLAKYATKALTPGEDGRDWWALADDLKGRRMAQSFGDAPALNLEIQRDEDKHIVLGTLESILYAAQQGDEEAITIIDQLRDHYGSVPGEKPPPTPPPDPRQQALPLETTDLGALKR